MNILVLTDGFPPLSNAGAEKIAYIISKEYISYGCSVSVITIDNNLKNGEIKGLSYNGLTVYQIGSSYNSYLKAYVSLFNPWVLKAIKNILNNNTFDLAHMHNIHAHISYSVISLLKKHVDKAILTAHDAMAIDYGKFTQAINPEDLSKSPKINKKINPFKTFLRYKRSYNPFRNIVIKYYLRKLDKIVTVSNAQEEILNANGIKNTQTINNGIIKYASCVSHEEVDVFKNKLNIKSDEKILLWAGRLSEAKGASQVIELIRKLINNNYKVKLLIAGSDIFKGHDLDQYIIPTGWLGSEEMRLAYNISDIILVPSIYPDPFPTVILESMQEGAPVVATCFGGAKEAVVDGQTGFVINPFNIDMFYQQVCKVLNDEKLSSKFCVESKKIFKEKFTIGTCMEKYLQTIKNI